MLGHVPPLPQQPQRSPFSGHMVVCGDDALAQRLAVELRYVYGERVTLVLPPEPGTAGPELPLTGRGRAAALFGRMSSAMNRNGGPGIGNGGTGGRDGDTNSRRGGGTHPPGVGTLRRGLRGGRLSTRHPPWPSSTTTTSATSVPR